MEKENAKRQRVAGSTYNQYLRRKDPLNHAPRSSKWYLAGNPKGIPQEGSCPSSDVHEAHVEAMDALQAYESVATSAMTDFSGNDAAEQIYEVDSLPVGTENETVIETPHSSATPLEDDFNEIFSTYQENHEIVLNLDDSQEMEQENNSPDDESRSTEGTQPVFEGSRLQLGASMLLIMTFTLKYSLTGEGLSDLLTLIGLHCPFGNLLTQSVGSFKKWFQHIKHPLKIHKYCSYCNLIITDIDLNNGIFPNELCAKNITDSSISHFIELPIADQIKSFFARPSFKSDIQYRFNRKKQSSHSIEDVYDGKVYRTLSQSGGILNNPYNLSLLWNTDGIPCFKSSNMSLWPLFFQLNELQYSKRSCPDNMILGGLWFGPKKPTMMSYTEPFVRTLQLLETQGIDIEENGTSFNTKVIVIGGTADLPARCIVCNTVQFNGKYGCCKCLQPGETCKTSLRGHVHVFPFKEENPDGPKRSNDNHMLDVAIVQQNNGVPSNGVKGPSFLQCLAFYDMISGTCIDYMHGVLLGVTKLLMSLWFSREHSGQPFSKYGSVDLVDRRLKWIKPPNNITRLPRSIKDHLKYWKASELRSWLLYSQTCLSDYLYSATPCLTRP